MGTRCFNSFTRTGKQFLSYRGSITEVRETRGRKVRGVGDRTERMKQSPGKEKKKWGGNKKKNGNLEISYTISFLKH